MTTSLLCRRLFHSTRRLMLEENSASLLEREKLKARENAQDWLRNEGMRFQYPDGSGKSNFVGRGGDKPFPMNPLYVAMPPLADSVKDRIFLQHQQSPDTETPIKLAKQYGISIARVQAILRLKALAKDMKEKKMPVQVHLSREMEKLLQATKKPKIPEPLRALPTERLKPLFDIVDEDEGVSPRDAANFTQSNPHLNTNMRLNKDAKSFQEDDSDSPLIHSKDPNQKSKFTFTIADTSNIAMRTSAAVLVPGMLAKGYGSSMCMLPSFQKLN
ncbi:hypothetical protein HDU76_001450 [Blyttiomyces sp. JEL0837]|nr:hypothetical protein HDU76_001450 [Blyttiomyces sp. JEL0837]